MTDLTANITALYQQFLSCWNARDFAGVADCFSEPAMYVLPNAAVPVPNRAAMVALLEKVFTGLENDGFSHTSIGQISIRQSGPSLAVIDASDVARIRTNGSIIEIIDGHYIAQKSESRWRFTVAASCDQGWRDNEEITTRF